MSNISRRQFLKLTTVAAVGTVLSGVAGVTLYAMAGNRTSSDLLPKASTQGPSIITPSARVVATNVSRLTPNITLQAGHRWTGTNNAAGDLDFTGDFHLGTQCIKLTTQSGAGPQAPTVVTSPRMAPVDLRTKMMRVWLKLDAASVKNLSVVRFYVGGGETAFSYFANGLIVNPAVDGHTAVVQPGEWVGLTLSPASLADRSGGIDWSAIQDFRLRIEGNGQPGQSATVYLGGIDFINNDPAYPHGVVTFTFDDGYASAFTQAKIQMDRYGFPGTVYVIHDVIGSTPYLSEAQLGGMHAGGWDIAPHADRVAHHNLGFDTLDPTVAAADLRDEVAWLKSLGYGPSKHWAYPRGLFDEHLIDLMKPTFSAARTTHFRSMETLPVGDPYRLRSIQPKAVVPNTEPGTLEWYVDQAYDFGGWLIVMFHDLVPAPGLPTEYAIDAFNTFVEYVAAKGIPVKTMTSVLG
jgi:peptidoglycan/xylan/chitin deacetylase (PgdA/CDA1 family)